MQILDAGDAYFDKTHRKVTYEYILIKELTARTCADEVVQLFRGKNVLINAIPINDNYDVGLYRPSKKEIQTFVDYIESKGIPITLRREMGSKIQAACGQLRIKHDQQG